MNDTKYEKLMKYEQIFLTAIKSNYARCTRSQYDDMINIYYGTSTLAYTAKMGYSCSRCRLNEIKQIAREYFHYAENHTSDIKI